MRVSKGRESCRAFRDERSIGRTACAVLAGAAALACADRVWAVATPLENAYWRFEEGTAGSPVSGTDGNAVVDSANANNMRTASSGTAPTYSSDVSAPIIPQTGLNNAVSMQFTGARDVYSDGKDINYPIISNGFTLEASFKLSSVGGAYQCIVGKDGQPVSSSSLAPLEFKVRGDNSKLQIEILDGSGADKQVSSQGTISPNQWYHAAAVDTGSSLSLYLDSGDGSGYVLQGSTQLSVALDRRQRQRRTPWSIGRGMFNNTPADWINGGEVDEVRLSNTALSPSSFLFAPATGRWNVDTDGAWSSPANWQNGIPRVAGATANLSDAISATRTITVDVPVTVGTLNFDNANGYLVNGSQTITIDMGSNNPGAINVLSGSHVVSVPVAFARDTTVSVTNTSDTLKLTSSLSASGVTLTKQGSGTLEVASLTADGVNINAGKLRFTPSGGTSALNQLGQINISNGGALDLGDNKLITATSVGQWNGTAYDGVTGMIQSGRNGGTWTGSGIVTSLTAALGSTSLTTIAVAVAGDIQKSSLGDVPVRPGTVLVMYTYAGDANLSGSINGDDYFRIDYGFANHLTGYENGDFNYDGVVNADDYFIIDKNYVRQGTPFSAGSILTGVSTTPEPAVTGIMVTGLCAMRRRRRRSRG